MKITKMETVLAGQRNFILKLYTDEGIVGVGQCGLWGAREGVVGTLKSLETAIIGADCRRINYICSKLYANQFKGMNIMSAIAAIDLALWDIRGKALNCPVYDLIGGKFRDKIRVWEPITANDLGEIRELALKAKEEGYTAIRINPTKSHRLPPEPVTSKNLSDMYNRVAVLRETVGNDIDIGIEIHRSLDPDTAIRLANMIEPLNILFYEDPCRSESVETLQYLISKVGIPVAAGERNISIQEFEMMFDAGLRLARPDIGTLAGMTGCIKVAHLAEAHHAGVIPHVANGAMSMVTSMHLCATLPNFAIMEKGPSRSMAESLLEFSDNSWKPEVVNGYVTLPDGPGWGIEINEDIEKKLPYVLFTMPSLAD